MESVQVAEILVVGKYIQTADFKGFYPSMNSDFKRENPRVLLKSIDLIHFDIMGQIL